MKYFYTTIKIYIFEYFYSNILKCHVYHFRSLLLIFIYNYSLLFYFSINMFKAQNVPPLLTLDDSQQTEIPSVHELCDDIPVIEVNRKHFSFF